MQGRTETRGRVGGNTEACVIIGLPCSGFPAALPVSHCTALQPIPNPCLQVHTWCSWLCPGARAGSRQPVLHADPAGRWYVHWCTSPLRRPALHPSLPSMHISAPSPVWIHAVLHHNWSYVFSTPPAVDSALLALAQMTLSSSQAMASPTISTPSSSSWRASPLSGCTRRRMVLRPRRRNPSTRTFPSWTRIRATHCSWS